MVADFAADNPDDVVVIVYHCYSDPWYDNNGQEHDARETYYGVGGIPDLFFDGTIQMTGWYWDEATHYAEMQSNFDDRIDIESPITIDIASTVGEDEVTAMAFVTSGDEAIDGDVYIRFVLVTTYWDDFIAGDGQDEWHDDMLDMAPDEDGLEFSIDANSTEMYETTFPWPHDLEGTEIEQSNIKVVVFVQDDDTEEVLQSNWAELGFGFDFVAQSEDLSHLTSPAESVTYDLYIENTAMLDDVYDITVVPDMPPEWSFNYTTPDGEQTGDATVSLAAGENYTSTITIFTSDAVEAVDGELTLTVTSQGLPVLTNSFSYYAHTPGQVLVVNGDAEGNNADFYLNALDAANNIQLAGTLTYSDWNKFEHVLNPVEINDVAPELIIWYTGATGTISPQECTALDEYLAGGGNLWITGSQAPFYLDGSALITSMGAEYQDHFEQGTSVFGVEADPYYGGLEFDIQGGDGADNRGIPSSLRDDGGTDCLKYSTIRRAGIRHEGEGYRTLLLGFPFEAIADVDSRNEVMLNSLGWLIEYDFDSVDELSAGTLPEVFSLEQNYPNPFNPETEIEFSLPVHTQVTLAVYDLMGREVAVLADAPFDAGRHAVSWNASDMPSGVYFYSIKTAGENSSFSSTRKMMLLK